MRIGLIDIAVATYFLGHPAAFVQRENALYASNDADHAHYSTRK